MRSTTLLLLSGLTWVLAPGVAQAQSPRERLRKRLAERQPAKDAKPSAKASLNVHGGKLTKVGDYTFEVVLRESYLRIYVLRKGQPVSSKGLGGKVTIGVLRRKSGRRGNHQTSSAKLKRVGVSKKRGRLRSYLQGSHKLGKADHQGMRLDVTITGLKGTKVAQTFRVSFNGLSPVVTFVCKTDAKIAAQDPGVCVKCAASLKRKVENRGEGKIGRRPR